MFPFRKKPPSKVEQFKKTVSEGVHSLLEHVPTEKIEDKIEDLTKSALHAAHEALEHGSDLAEAATHKLSHARDGALAAKDSAVASASHFAENTRERFSKGAHAAQDAGHDAVASVKKRAHKKAEQIEDEIESAPPILEIEPVEWEVRDTSSKWLWVGVGLLAGGTLALLFAPTSGRRSRAAIQDRLGKVGKGAADAKTKAADKAADLVNRAEGMAHKMEQKLAEAPEIDDITLVDRVRSALGHVEAIKSLERLNIDANEGVITLRGPMVDAELQGTIETAVKAVLGVKDVRSEFLADEEPADPAIYAS